MSLTVIFLFIVGFLALVLLGILVAVLVSRLPRSGSSAEPGSAHRRSLGSKVYPEREAAIRAAAEQATPEDHRLLVEHLAQVRGAENEQELLEVFRAFLSGWGIEHTVEHWDGLPARARMDFLALSEGSSQFSREEVLVLSRRGMQDDQESIARRAWRTYGYTVTAGLERDGTDFDFAAWLERTADDPHTEIQGLRRRLEQRRLAETQNQSLESLAARYRAEVFKLARSTGVQLRVEEAVELDLPDGKELSLPPGSHAGRLGGSFDNAHNAVHEGWTFVLELDDVEGRALRLESTRSTDSFFGEILHTRHDDQRHWFDEAPDELVSAFSMQPFTGPMVAYGDAWDLYAPQIDGEPVVPEKRQVLSSLVAVVPGEAGAGSRLGFLLYEFEDAANDGDEVRPFVTTIELSSWLLVEGEDEIDELTARVL